MDFTAIINDLTGRISDFAQAKPLIALAILLILPISYTGSLYFSSLFSYSDCSLSEFYT